MVIGALLKEATAALTAAGISSARLDSEVLLAFVLKKERLYLAMHKDADISAELAHRFRRLIDRRAAHEPVAYLTGCREFMSLPFYVAPGVLIPRPDTETLVEFALERLDKKIPYSILDLCTGSGAIAVSLAYYLPESHVTAVDISPLCTEAAQKNAAQNGVAARVTVLQADVYKLSDEKKYDCVVSNPPYIPSGVLPGLEPDVRDYEPATALDGGSDGLDFYRFLTKKAAALLKPAGLLAFEVGHDQSDAVMALLQESGSFQDIGTRRDLAGICRVVYGIRHKA